MKYFVGNLICLYKMSTEEKGMDMSDKIQEELKLLEEKNNTVIDQIRLKSEELNKLKESALLIIGAKAVLTKLLS